MIINKIKTFTQRNLLNSIVVFMYVALEAATCQIIRPPKKSYSKGSEGSQSRVVKISRQPAHFTGYRILNTAPVTPNVSRSVLSVILEK